MISSEKEIPLVEANRIAELFLQNLKDAYGEDVFPEESPLTFHFEVSVDGMGQITSPLPTLDQIEMAKGNWSNSIKMFLRPHFRPNHPG
jgi:hypothetical protein